MECVKFLMLDDNCYADHTTFEFDCIEMTKEKHTVYLNDAIQLVYPTKDGYELKHIETIIDEEGDVVSMYYKYMRGVRNGK